MRLPRFRIRTLMIAVAVVAVAFVVVPPWWRYWFHSPYRVITYVHGSPYDGIREILYIKWPAHAAYFERVKRKAKTEHFQIKIERFAELPK